MEINANAEEADKYIKLEPETKIKKEHTDIKLFSCGSCDKSFFITIHLNKHKDFQGGNIGLFITLVPKVL